MEETEGELESARETTRHKHERATTDAQELVAARSALEAECLARALVDERARVLEERTVSLEAELSR